jgi:hypothetical protein
MKKELFGNILVLNLIKRLKVNQMSTSTKTNGNKQQLKIDITSDNICRESNCIKFEST